jgi:hypothetical protein
MLASLCSGGRHVGDQKNSQAFRWIFAVVLASRPWFMLCFVLLIVTCHLLRLFGCMENTPWKMPPTTAPLSCERAVTNQNNKDTPAFSMQVLDRHQKRHT